jgi:hypothetical protein
MRFEEGACVTGPDLRDCGWLYEKNPVLFYLLDDGRGRKGFEPLMK